MGDEEEVVVVDRWMHDTRFDLRGSGFGFGGKWKERGKRDRVGVPGERGRETKK